MSIGFITNRRLLLSSSDAFGRVMYSYKVGENAHTRWSRELTPATGTGRARRIHSPSVRLARHDGRRESGEISEKAGQQFQRRRQQEE